MTALHRYTLLVVVTLLAALLGGCASTQIVSSWKSETFNPGSSRNAIGEVVKVTSRATGEILKARG